MVTSWQAYDFDIFQTPSSATKSTVAGCSGR